MKKIAIYFMVLLFVLQSTSYSWIIASFYVNQDYIAQNICINRFDQIPVCNGSCFLDQELTKENKKEQKSLGAKEKEIQLFVQVLPELDFTGYISEYRRCETIQTKNQSERNPFLYSVFHPPELA